MSFTQYGVHAAGATIAASSGFALFAGASIIWSTWEVACSDAGTAKGAACEREREPPYQVLLRRAAFLGLGGASFTFGAFAFVPRVFRAVWMS